MATGLNVVLANSLLNSLLRGSAYPAPYSTIYIQLHTGLPGLNGTSNIATNNTRKVVTYSAAGFGICPNSSTVTWASVPATETYTHYSLWTAVTSGTFVLSGTVANGAAVSGQPFNFDPSAIAEIIPSSAP